MASKTNTDFQREYRKRARLHGFRTKTLWIHEDDLDKYEAFVASLKKVPNATEMKKVSLP